jgi:drug/metabolite transporter (DMT)-like permease
MRFHSLYSWQCFDIKWAMNKKPWLLYAIITTVSWGIWGALSEWPTRCGYIVWSITMIPCALIALKLGGWHLDRNPRAVGFGLLVGFTGACAQLSLFRALKEGPAYIVFPIISLYPVVTITLSMLWLKERTGTKGKIGIALALLAIGLLSYRPPSDAEISSQAWLIFSFLIFLLWGLQAFVMKFANSLMTAESVFFYMMVASVTLSPVAFLMTDTSQAIEWGLKGPYASAAIQILNSLGALFLVYSIRYGKTIVVAPLTSLAPVITILLSLIFYGVMPIPTALAGMVIASVSIYLLALE